MNDNNIWWAHNPAIEAQNRIARRAAAAMINERKTKFVGLWPQRFGWACVISRSELWGELPIEINRMIVDYLVDTYYQCVACPEFIPDKNAFHCDKCFFGFQWNDRSGLAIIGRAVTLQTPGDNIEAFLGHNH